MRIRARLSHRERNALVFCVAFIAATLLLSLVDQNSFIHTARFIIDPNYLQVQYTGTDRNACADFGDVPLRAVRQQDERVPEYRIRRMFEKIRGDLAKRAHGCAPGYV